MDVAERSHRQRIFGGNKSYFSISYYVGICKHLPLSAELILAGDYNLVKGSYIWQGI